MSPSLAAKDEVQTEVVFWVCMASRWMVPPISCREAGTGHAKAQKHTELTGHATMQTIRQDTADRLLASTL